LRRHQRQSRSSLPTVAPDRFAAQETAQVVGKFVRLGEPGRAGALAIASDRSSPGRAAPYRGWRGGRGSRAAPGAAASGACRETPVAGQHFVEDDPKT